METPIDYPVALFVAGCIMLVIDLAFLNVGIILFAGIAGILLSGVAFLDVGGIWSLASNEEGNTIKLLTVIGIWGATTAAVAALLWKPFKHLQNRTPQTGEVGSDLIGRELQATQAIGANEGQVMFSGAPWSARRIEGEAIIAIDALVVVVEVRGNTLMVKEK
jgi:membrane-bound ClpP family serine protease